MADDDKILLHPSSSQYLLNRFLTDFLQKNGQLAMIIPKRPLKIFNRHGHSFCRPRTGEVDVPGYNLEKTILSQAAAPMRLDGAEMLPCCTPLAINQRRYGPLGEPCTGACINRRPSSSQKPTAMPGMRIEPG